MQSDGMYLESSSYRRYSLARMNCPDSFYTDINCRIDLMIHEHGTYPSAGIMQQQMLQNF